MNTSEREQSGPRQGGGSILEHLPTPEEIRQKMAANAEENRALRSLYRVARRLAERKRQAAESGQGVPDED